MYEYNEKKIVGIIASNVEPAIALNVTGHLGVSIGAYGVDVMGREELLDKSRNKTCWNI